MSDGQVHHELRTLGAATVFEASEDVCAVVEPFFTLSPSDVVAGPAFLVKCAPGDNLALRRAVARAQPGDVLVADAGGNVSVAHWGEMLTVAAQTRGIAGLIIDGGVRDANRTSQRGFPVFHKGLCIAGPTKAAPLEPDPSELCLGECMVRRGDTVVADRDGIAVIPADRVDQVLVAARARAVTEASAVAAVADGKTTLELLGLDG